MTTINAQINSSNKIVAKNVTLHDVTAASVGLENVDNTSDINKPISTATQAALDLKADQSTTYTKTEVDTNISNLVNSAPETLDTLNELAAALNDDENFATTITDSIATKAPINNPSFTGDLTNFSGLTNFDKKVKITPERGLGLQLFSSGTNNAAVSLQVQGPTTVGHDLFQRSGFTNGFGDGSNHFHSLIDINRIEQEAEGDVKNTKRVQERYYAIQDNLLPNNKAVFWAQHRVARPISTTVIDTSTATLDVSLLQNSTNRNANNQVFFVSNTTPLNKSEELEITLNSHTLSTGDNVRMEFGQSFAGPIVAAQIFGKVTTTTTNTFKVELYGGNYKTTSEVPLGTDQTALTFDDVVLETIGTNTIVQSGNEINLQLYSKTNFTPNRLKDETLKATWSVAHGLVKNEHCTLITDGRNDLVIKQAAYVLDPDPDSDGLSAILVYGRRIKQFDLGYFTAFGSSNWTLHKGSIDGIHDDTLGDNLINFNANNHGDYTAYQIGPGSQTDADCISIGKNVYNKDASTIKIGYDNEMLDVRSDGIVVDGNVTGTTPTTGAHLTTKDYVDTALDTHTSDTNNPHSVTSAQVGLNNVTNESKATMFTNPSFTGNVNVPGGLLDFGHRTSDATIIRAESDSHDITLIRAASNSDAVGVSLKYIGSGSADENIFEIATDGGGSLKIDNSGDVGINTAPVDGIDLAVGTLQASNITPNGDSHLLIKTNDDTGNGITIQTGTNATSSAGNLNIKAGRGLGGGNIDFFSDTFHAVRIDSSSSFLAGGVGTPTLYVTKSSGSSINKNSVSIGTGSIPQATLDVGGNVLISESLKIGSGKELKEYDYGTFAPKLALNGTTEQSTYSKQEGYYVKIGRQVTVNIVIKVTHFDSAFKTAGTNDELGITGLPHSAKIEGSDGPDAMIVQVHPRKGWQNLGDNSYSGSVGSSPNGVIFFEKSVGQGEFGPAPGAGVGWNYERIKVNDFHFHPFNFTADGTKAFTFQISGTYITDDDV